MGVGGQRHVPAAFTPGKVLVPIAQEAGWASGPVWTGAENHAPTGIRSPDRPARRQSLYRTRYPAHKGDVMSLKFSFPKYQRKVNEKEGPLLLAQNTECNRHYLKTTRGTNILQFVWNWELVFCMLRQIVN